MSTHRRTWQKREQHAATLVGAQRQPGSGSAGREDQTSSDSTHPRLYLESKVRARSATWALWKAAAKKAAKERKTPVLVLYEKGKHGGLWIVHENDLLLLADEIIEAST